MRSLEGHAGFFVVSAMREPSQEQQFMLRVLAQETGIALSNTWLHTRERSRSSELREANEALEASVAGAREARRAGTTAKVKEAPAKAAAKPAKVRAKSAKAPAKSTKAAEAEEARPRQRKSA